ncbi:MAG TPA: 16S rRNA (cytosine(1402)-N(4))-methyltransferase RsmH [Planctomycetes bacterium]|nr:16S rRNA (cytosine(1402)-N(4))-methyltransferase RsmH [Planctomycetota bacterium]HIK61444.1 16S rRNA (cytosine(1402)-N(4))-methyltransferase RsmH [Planctomycetota bacterium]
MTPDSNDVHVPVLAEEVVALLGGSGDILDPSGLIVDATLGAGGHSASLLECFPRIRVLGTDQDPSILECARKRLEPHGDRVHLVQCRISELSRLLRKLRIERPVGFLFDFGASSLQLDTPGRGFSFQDDGPLDMRMDPGRIRTAADVVNTWDEDDLADLFYAEGGERKSRPIAAEIVRCRSRAAFQRTGALAELVVRIVGRTGKIHPATRVFQALRRAVNEEGEELLAGMETAEHWLADGGVMAAISFHSGEDREVKHFLREGVVRDCWRLEPKKPIQASREEQRKNPRARSAILRGAVRVRGEDECE